MKGGRIRGIGGSRGKREGCVSARYLDDLGLEWDESERGQARESEGWSRGRDRRTSGAR